MALDHSLTYKQKTLKNVPHRKRLKKIIKLLYDNNVKSYGNSYLDVGCSNGYLTNLISQSFNYSRVKGIDHNLENLNNARKKYRDIEFEFINLNSIASSEEEKFHLVTCFETLEHVGSLNNAISSILSFAQKDSSFIILSVPIEIGFWGVIKFVTKKLYGYNLKELPNNVSAISYFKDLILTGNIAKYRDDRKGWGTHFGFDYRKIDTILIENKCPFKAINYFTTRFYLIEKTVSKK